MTGARRLATQRPFDRGRARDALAGAHLPALVMSLFQLTGDRRWLQAPFRPTRARGIDDHDDGGFSDDIQVTIRDAAVDALDAWHHGVPAAVPHPTVELVQEMMAAFAGEQLPTDFAGMMASLFEPDDGVANRSSRQVAIIGAGISGLCAAIMLQRAGIGFTIFEENDEVGGTWWTNRYPGAGVDTPSFLYEFSFFPRAWRYHYSGQAEVGEYLREVAAAFDVVPHVRFNAHVVEARYDEAARRWQVRVDVGGRVEVHRVDAVVSAVGFLNRPKVPELGGMHTFHGPMFHSAMWPAGLDVSGKRVAVVGSGASAMQIVSSIAGVVEHLTVYQRSPQWIAPNPKAGVAVSSDMHWLLHNVPFYQEWYRIRLAWNFNDRAYPSLVVDPAWPEASRSVNRINDKQREFFTEHLRAELEGRPDLQHKSLPDYPPYGKRLLLDHGWFASLRRPNVELVTEAVVGFTDDGVRDATGDIRPADVVILCTGFQTQKYIYPLDIVGRDGRRLREVWGEDDARAYLGITVPGFPNLFVMYGPNTNPGGGSVISVVECQAKYIAGLLSAMDDRGVDTVECLPDRHEQYNEHVDRTHAGMIWTHPGMTTYFRNPGGRVVTNMPWRQMEYWRLTSEPQLDDFHVQPSAGSEVLR